MSPDLREESGSAIDRLIGTTVDGKYRIDSLLGRGGMGAVFRAVHLGTDRTVALKVIVPDYAGRSDFLARFEREARACGRLRHPNIVDVTDFGYDDSGGRRIAYLVMEYLDGCSLADVLRDETSLPIAWVVDVMQQTGSAVEEAHRAGILHRDLKPDNIWLEPNRRGGYTVKVLDFGLAKLGLGDPEPHPPAAANAGRDDVRPARISDATEEATRVRDVAIPAAETRAADADDATGVRPPAAAVAMVDDVTSLRPATATTSLTDDDDSATAMGSIVGTPAYMSPEQCRGLPLTAHSDVYSLAVISYRLLGGALPFSGKSEALLAAHISETPRPLGELRRDLPKEAVALIMRGLAKAPEDRPKSAGAFTEMLAAHAQTTAAFLEDAMLMFMQHARAFLSASVAGLSPVLALGLLAALNALAYVYGVTVVPRSYAAPLIVAAIMATVGPGMLMVQGLVVPAVMQAVVAPLQPIDVKTLQRRFQPRFRTYLRSVAPLLSLFVVAALWQVPARSLVIALSPLVRDENGAVGIAAALATALLPNIPMLAMLFLMGRSGSMRSFQFLAAVAVVEGLPVKEALKRGAELANSGAQSRPIRVLLMGTGAMLGFSGAVGVGLLARRLPAEVAFGTLAVFLALAFVLIGPFFAVIGALNYLRARRALGEPLDKALADFERAVLPESHWKLGERERVATLIASRR